MIRFLLVILKARSPKGARIVEMGHRLFPSRHSPCGQAHAQETSGRRGGTEANALPPSVHPRRVWLDGANAEDAKSLPNVGTLVARVHDRRPGCSDH